MNSEPKFVPSTSRQHELLWVLAIILVSLLINLAVAPITPTIGADESGYTDPAANHYFGAGFTSTMWGQDRHTFWCGNVPLYQILLCGFFKLFGFGLLQARAVNDFLTAGASFLIWAGVRQAEIIKTPRWRLVCLLLVLSGSVSTVTFRTIRPDATMFSVCAAVFYFSTLPPRWHVRHLLTALATALLPVAGIAMLPYWSFLAMISLFCFGLRSLAQLTSICIGFLGGIISLVLFYGHFASFKAFTDIILPFTALGAESGNAGQSLLSRKLWGEAPGTDNIFTCFFGNPLSTVDPKTLCDYGAVLLFILFIILVVRSPHWSNREFRRKVLFVIILTLVLPPVMHFAGHYRSMYRWMTYIPLTIAISWLMESEWEELAGANLKRMALMVVCICIALGVPVRTLTAVAGWTNRSMAPLDYTVAHLVRPDDVVICDRKEWFPLRAHASLVYVCNQPARGEFSQTVDLPTNQVSLLCLFPNEYDLVVNKIGGNWQKLPASQVPGFEALQKTRYAADFYRRSN
jgi:hypothetical protein